MKIFISALQSFLCLQSFYSLDEYLIVMKIESPII
jgi:hypothetical protein